MSKMLNNYYNLKKQNSNIIYLFKNGIFYVAIEDDAKFLANVLNLKLTNLNAESVKCGFPCSSFDKYYFKLNSLNIQFKIIDKDTICDSDIYIENKIIKDILQSIKKVDINNLSVSNAFSFIENLQNSVNSIEDDIL